MNEASVLLDFNFDHLDPSGTSRVETRFEWLNQVQASSGSVTLDSSLLDNLRNDVDAYCQELTRMFFLDRSIFASFVQAQATQVTNQATLHLRFNVPRDAIRLHAVIWELLGDPQGASPTGRVPPLGRGERVFMSRTLSPSVLAPQRNPGNRRLKALAVIASPSQMTGHSFRLPPINVPAERSLIKASFKRTAELQVLEGADASWKNVSAEVKRGVDVLYLACHGSLIEDVPKLYLEQAGKEVDEVDANVFCDQLRNQLQSAPRLIVLAACQTGGGGDLSEREDNGFLAAFAARLVDAGVPAVVGMQGRVEENTSIDFVQELFTTFLVHRQIEKAVSSARDAVKHQKQWWMPVLLREPGGQPIVENRPPFVHWDDVINSFAEQQCLPILGSEIVAELSNRAFSEYLLSKMAGARLLGANPEPSKIAQQYKILNGFSDDKGQMQFVVKGFVQSALKATGVLPKPGESLDDLLKRWADTRAGRESCRLLDIVASLPVPVFLTTNGDSLLQHAFRRRDPPREPETEVLPWRGEMAKVQELKDQREADELPTLPKPLVHHLFGHYGVRAGDPSSIVVTEDDFFDYLIWLVANRQIVWIRTRLCESSLLFLGFRLEDWEFRLLLRSIAKLQGSEYLRTRTHVAVQIPDVGEPDERENIQTQLESYFKNSDVTLAIFWGTVDEFLEELDARLPAELKELLATAQLEGTTP